MFHSVICEKLCVALKLNGYSVQFRVGQWFGTQDVIDNLSGQGLMIQRTRGINENNGYCSIPHFVYLLRNFMGEYAAERPACEH